MNTASTENKEIITMGDFNTNYLKTDNRDFKAMLNVNGYTQLVKLATRITESTLTLIDLIASNNPTTISNVSVISTSISDHDIVGCIRKLNNIKYEPRTLNGRNYANYDSNQLNGDVEKHDWNPLYNMTNVNDALNYFNDSLKTLFDKHALIISKKVKGKPSGWLNANVKKDMNTRDQLLRKARR